MIGVAAAPILVWFMASGLEQFDGAVWMTRLMFPYIGFMSLVALAAGILNTWRRFAVPAATPVLLNLYTSRLGDAAAPLRPRIDQQLEAHFAYLERELRPSGFFVGRVSLHQHAAPEINCSSKVSRPGSRLGPG